MTATRSFIRVRRWSRFLVIAASLLATWPGFAFAQTASMEILLERMDRMERDMRAMSRNLYRGDGPAPQGQGFAMGDAGETELRIQELERQVRALTRVVNDQARIIQRLENGRGGGQVSAAQPPLRETVPPPPLPPAKEVNGSPGVAPGRTTKTLGEVPAEQVRQIEGRGQQAVAAAKATAATVEPEPGETPEILFDRSRQLLLNQDTVAAETGFNRFLVTYPDHELASEARFWLGETYYVREDYTTAAKIFLESYKRDPRGGKAPNSLLKLGMSLSKLGSTKEACTTYRKLLQDFPKMRANMQNIAKTEQQRNGCR